MNRILSYAAAAVLTAAGPIAAQSAAARTPNISGGWTAPPGVVQFNFLHRFSVSDPPLRKVTNTPTFNVATGVTDRVMVGLTYGSNSALVPSYPNEWEFHARALPVSQAAGRPIDLSVQGGYNLASESVDAEVQVGRAFGPVRAVVAGRAFTEAYDGQDARYAVAGGAVVRLTDRLALAGDYAVLTDRADGEPPAWGAGLQIGIPYTPHSMSIHATNVGTASLEGASRGTRTRWGFEYTVPITLGRYLGGGGGSGGSGGAVDMAASAGGMAQAGTMANGDTVTIDIRNIQYGQTELTVTAGTTVVWINQDPIQHSVTADGGAFDSGLLDPNGGRFVRTFGAVGSFSYHCVPHPFMKGTVTVVEMDGDSVQEASR